MLPYTVYMHVQATCYSRANDRKFFDILLLKKKTLSTFRNFDHIAP